MYIPYQFLTAMEEDRLRRPARQPRRTRVFLWRGSRAERAYSSGAAA